MTTDPEKAGRDSAAAQPPAVEAGHTNASAISLAQEPDKAANDTDGTSAKAVPADPTAARPVQQPVAPEEGRTKLETTLIVIALASALFLAALDVTIVTVAIPSITEEFNSPAGYTWIGAAFTLANAAAAPSWGKISDIFGRKPVLLTAVGTFWIGSLLSAVAVNMSMLIAARAIQVSLC
jgi:hypothetical protein